MANELYIFSKNNQYISDIYQVSNLIYLDGDVRKENMQQVSLYNESFYCLTKNHQSNLINNGLWYVINLNFKKVL